MKYRIVQKTSAHDSVLRKKYHVQCKIWFFFWEEINSYYQLDLAEELVANLQLQRSIKKQESTKVIKEYND